MQENGKSKLLFLLSMVIWGSIGIFRRGIPLSSSVLACYRGFCGVLVLLAAAGITRHPIHQPIEKKKGMFLVLSGVLMGFNWILLFEAYNYTTVPTATLCYYMQPTIVILLSPLLFRERIGFRKGICALTALIGMVLVSGVIEKGVPSSGEGKGILLGLGAAFLYAMVVILNKKVPGIDGWEKTILQLLSAAVVLLPYILLTEKNISFDLSGSGILMLVILGLVHTGLAYALYFGSMDGLKAQTAALFSYADPVVALVLSAAVLHESLTWTGILGAVLIIGAAMMNEIAKKGNG